MNDDTDTIAGIRAGDESAFTALVRAHYPGLYRFALRYVRDREAAHDLLQEVFVRIWEQRERWEVRTTVAAYLYGALRNHAVNYLRNDRTARRWRGRWAARAEGMGGQAESTDAAIELAELDRAIVGAIDQLPLRCREVFLLSRDKGFTYGEIATVLGISPKAVEHRMGKALKLLRIAARPFLALSLFVH